MPQKHGRALFKMLGLVVCEELSPSGPLEASPALGGPYLKVNSSPLRMVRLLYIPMWGMSFPVNLTTTGSKFPPLQLQDLSQVKGVSYDCMVRGYVISEHVLESILRMTGRQAREVLVFSSPGCADQHRDEGISLSLNACLDSNEIRLQMKVRPYS